MRDVHDLSAALVGGVAPKRQRRPTAVRHVVPPRSASIASSDDGGVFGTAIWAPSVSAGTVSADRRPAAWDTSGCCDDCSALTCSCWWLVA